MILTQVAINTNLTRFICLVVGLVVIPKDAIAQAPPITAREVFAKRDLIGGPSFLGFDVSSNVLEYRDNHRGNRAVGLRSVNIHTGKDNWFIDKVNLPIKINPAGNLIVVPNIVFAKKQSTEEGFRLLRAIDGLELYATTREPVAAFAFDFAKNKFVTYGYNGHSFQFWKLEKTDVEVKRAELVKPSNIDLFSDAQTYNGAFSPNLKYFAAQIVHYPIVAPQKYYVTVHPAPSSCGAF